MADPLLWTPGRTSRLVARSVPVALCVTTLALPRLAVAQEPVLTSTSGNVEAYIDLTVPPEKVRAFLADPAASSHLVPDVLSVDVTSQGTCQDIGLTTRGLSRPLAVRVRRCPTSDGWRQDLVQSEDFTSYEMVWKIQALATGTRVIFHLVMDVNLPVPHFLIHRGVIADAKGTLSALKAKLQP
jgi:hypothetical protein